MDRRSNSFSQSNDLSSIKNRCRRFAGPHFAAVDFAGLERGPIGDQEPSPGGTIRRKQQPEQQQPRAGL